MFQIWKGRLRTRAAETSFRYGEKEKMGSDPRARISRWQGWRDRGTKGRASSQSLSKPEVLLTLRGYGRPFARVRVGHRQRRHWMSKMDGLCISPRDKETLTKECYLALPISESALGRCIYTSSRMARSCHFARRSILNSCRVGIDKRQAI